MGCRSVGFNYGVFNNGGGADAMSTCEVSCASDLVALADSASASWIQRFLVRNPVGCCSSVI